MSTLKRILSRQSPLTLLFVTASAIFTVEIAIMFLLPLIHLMSPLAEALLDAALLVAVLFPVLYLFLFRLMARRIVERKQVEATLQQANQELESKVAARTRELNNAVEQLSHELKQRKRAESRLAKLNECLLSFGSDPNENINRLVAFCGEQLQATCALYNRLEGDTLYSLGQWNTPPDYNPVDKPDGHICYDVIRGGGNDARVIRDLLQTSYAQTDPNVVRYGLQTYVGKAVSFGGAFVGSLCVVYQEDRTPSEDDLNLLGIAASAVGVEEKRKQAEQEIQRRVNEITALYETTRDLTAMQRDFPSLLQAIVQRAATLLAAFGGGMYLYDAAHGDLEYRVTTDPSTPIGIRLTLGEGMAGRVAQTRQPLIVDDYRTWPQRSSKYEGVPITAVIEVPMLYSGELIGVLAVHEVGKTTRKFTEDDAHLLSLFAGQAAGAVHNVRLFAESQQRAAEMSALQETALDLVSHLETKPLLETIIRRATDLLGVTGGVIYQWEEPAQQLRCTITHHLSRDYTNMTLRPGEGMAGRVYQTGQPLVVNDYAHWEGRAAHFRDIPSRAVISVPILWQNRVIGVINVNDESGARTFDDRDVRLLGLFANQAAIAIENAQLYAAVQQELAERKQTEEKLAAKVTELEQHNREIKLLNEMGDLLQSCQTVEETSAVVAQFARKLFPNESGALCLIAPSRNFVEAIATWGESPPPERVFTPDDCWALRRGQVHSVVDPRSGLLCRHVSQSFGPSTLPRVAGQAFGQDAPLPPERQPKGGYLCAPMMAQGETLGILHLQSRQSGPSQTREELAAVMTSQQQLAATLAGHIALALANLKLREALRQQAIRDPLTGLFNRRYMEETLERELRRAERRQAPLGIIMFDLDHFKKFNDTFGHAAGDIVLREIGAFLQTHVRAEDIACRLGGEEFIVILPEASLEDTLKRAEQLREGVKQLQVRYHDQALGAVTVSLGVAVFPEHGSTAEATLQVADAALYRAKREGRDRVAVGTTTEE